MTAGVSGTMTDCIVGVPVIGSIYSLSYLLREAVSSERLHDLDLDDQCEEKNNTFPVLRCRVCNLQITSDDQRIQIAESHQHTFINPVGIVYELGCFAKAPGCRIVGEASNEFSWFAGYMWQIAVCARCETHLGWCFKSTVMDFYGLILSTLTDGEK